MDAMGAIAIVITPVLVGIIGWFILHFVKRHDSFKTDVYKKLDDHSSKMTKEVTRVQEIATVIHKDALDSQQVMLNFKSNIKDELYLIKNEARELVTQITVANEGVKSLNILCEKTEKTIVDHQKIISHYYYYHFHYHFEKLFFLEELQE